ncbi:hypothetical protein [Paenibacillus massiliensis]
MEIQELFSYSDAADYLKSLGASEVISREDVAENSSKPLLIL